METEILKLVYNYSKEKRIADKQLIYQLITILSTHYQLTQYIKELEFYDELLFEINDQIITIAYNYLTKKITISMEGIKIIAQKKTQHNQTMLSEIETYFYYNLLITQAIIHDIEHIIHERNIDKNNSDLETQLIKICTQDNRRIKQLSHLFQETKEDYYQQEINILTNKYIKHYQYNPSERLAQISSLQLIIKIIDPLKKEIPNLYRLETIYLLQEMIKGYKIFLFYMESPTLKYLSKMDYLSDLKNLAFYHTNTKKLESNIINTLSKEERVNLGLSITSDEYKFLKRNLYLLQRKIKN